jgi:hypothetical protein
MDIQEVVFPVESLAVGSLGKIHFRDAWRLRLPGTRKLSVDDAVRLIFSATPGWVSSLMRVRDMVAVRFGLKTAGNVRRDPKEFIFEPGKSNGLFKVYARNGREIVMGEDDRHLDFRVSVLLDEIGEETLITVCTVVRFNRLLGRLYFLPVRPFHRIIVPAILRHMARTVGGE